MNPMKWRPLRSVAVVFGGIGAALGNARVRNLLTLTVTLIGLSSLFYCWAEGWSWLDSIFFSVITISTVGYGDLVPQTAIGKIFTVGLIFCGIGLFVAAATEVANTLIERARRNVDTPAPDPPED